MKKIIVLTSGGDAPGMNAAIRAVVRTAHHYGVKTFGCRQGFQGLIDRELFPLEPESVANCIQLGGTILKAGRTTAFLEKTTRDTCREFLKEQQVDGMVVIGGNGSFKGAALLSSEGGPAVIGIPGTIDNDILNTDYTIGFDTARNTALSAIDKVRDTASSHDRHFLVEVMGRSSGFLALDVGLAGGAEFILLPEFPITMTDFATAIQAPRRKKQSSIIVVAEANQPGRTIKIAEELEKLTGFPYRVCILGHIQRGGSPTLLDRNVASNMGYLAVKGLLSGATHKMASMLRDQLSLQPIPDPTAGPRIITSKEIVDLNNILCA
ncbi:MAG: 6-phosphofructokinase [Pseudomonadota bacterium]